MGARQRGQRNRCCGAFLLPLMLGSVLFAFGCSAVADFENGGAGPGGLPPGQVGAGGAENAFDGSVDGSDILPLPDGTVVLADGAVHAPDAAIRTDAARLDAAPPPSTSPPPPSAPPLTPMPPSMPPAPPSTPPTPPSTPPTPPGMPMPPPPVTPSPPVCTGGCDDGIACTVDVCQPSGRCVHMADGNRCASGVAACFSGRCLPELAMPGQSGCFAVPLCTNPKQPKCDTSRAMCVACLVAADCPAVDCCTPGECLPNGSCRQDSQCSGEGPGKGKDMKCCGADSNGSCQCAKKCDGKGNGNGGKGNEGENGNGKDKEKDKNKK